MGNFTFEEMNLMCIYNTGSRTGLIDSLREMRGELAPEETELRELTDSALGKGLVGLRDCVQELIDLQMDAAVPDSTIREKQAELNSLYDSFSSKYGLINDRANRLAYADDSSYYLLCALEVIDEDGKLERKADMFTKRTMCCMEEIPCWHMK